MKFQINETVESPDAELVSRVLETCLKAQWNDVAREGSTIVLHGLGASPRAVNRSDTTVFAVKIAEGGKTAIEADVTYQASALVGAAAPQNELVQRKLYSVLELVRMDLDLAKRKAAHAAERELKPRLKEVAEPEPVIAEMPAVETRAATEAELIAEAEAAIAEAGLVAKAEVATAKAGLIAKAEVATAEAGPVAKGGPAAEFAPAAEVAPAVEAPSVAEAALLAEAEAAIAEAELVAKGAPAIAETTSWAGLDLPSKSEGESVEKKVVAAEPAEVVIENLDDIPAPAPPPAAPATPKVAAVPMLNRREEKLVVERSKQTKTAKDRTAGGIFSQILLLFVLAAIGQVGWQYRVQLKEWMGGQRVSWTNTPSAPLKASWNSDADSSAADTAPVDTPRVSTGPVNTGPADTGRADTGIATTGLTAGEAAGQVDVSAAEEAANEGKLAEPDPTMWLERWGDALRGEDAGLQASFYADKVDKYFLKNDVSRSEVMADKEAAIQGRRGWWTLTLDDVVVAQHTETTARILLVKHFMIDDGKAGVKDKRLPTQLQLKRVDGRWQITSEQTLGW